MPGMGLGVRTWWRVLPLDGVGRLIEGHDDLLDSRVQELHA